MEKSKVQVVMRVLSLLKEEQLDWTDLSVGDWLKRGYDCGYRDGYHQGKNE